VPACNTIAEAWDLVRAAEESGAGYFLAENYCFRRENLLVLNLVEKGLFGELTFAECGYIHDCRSIAFRDDGSLTWRGKENSDPAFRGNSYPTHSLGPVSMWLGITRGDRFARCVTLESKAAARRRFAVKRFGPGSPAAAVATWNGDTVQSLIVTERGALVSVRFDSASPRPHRMAMATLRGTDGSYDDERGIYLEGRSPGWEPLARHQPAEDHPAWTRAGGGGTGGGHDGADRLTLRHFLECLRGRRPAAIDVYDAVTWSALVELSRLSILGGGAPQEYPDFTRGAWKDRKRYGWKET
jgi:predicted dehydrogenase